VMNGAKAQGARFADFLLSPEGQKVLGSFGVAPPK